MTMHHPPTTIGIPTGDECPVWADLYPPAGHDRGERLRRVVVLCHGMKGHRLWGFIPRLAGELSGADLPALAIDFSHNGVAGGDAGGGGGAVYRDPAAMRRNTLDRERRDLAAVVRFVRSGGGGRFARNPTVGLWGHSRGGTSVVLNSLETPGNVAAIATWSVPAHADIYQPRQKRRWREAGEYEWLEGVSGQRLAMGIDFLNDLEARGNEYDLAARSAGSTVPHLIVHGEVDLVIPPHHAERIAASRPRGVDTRTLLLRAGHTYGIGKSDNPAALATAIVETVRWFKRYLPAGGDKK